MAHRLHRRELFAILSGAGALGFRPPAAAAAPEKPFPLGIVIHSYGIRSAASKERRESPWFGTPLAFLEYCHTLGAGGIQIGLAGTTADDAAKLRAQAERYAMYIEGSITAPKNADDVARFTADVQAAVRCGADVLRCPLLNGRRYETFDSAEAFRRHTDEAWESLKLAAPIVERNRVRLAIENHKDFRADELAALIKKLGSPNVGVCLDTGNNLALLESAEETVAALAPLTRTTHIKDMGVAEYEQGFLLAEVPLGEGCLNLSALIATIRKANPTARMNLEMITRDPLPVPCLTDKYWTTFGDVKGQALAATLARVRKNASPTPFPRISQLSPAERLRLEEEHVRRSLAYWRKQF